jgi:hypothetical protein
VTWYDRLEDFPPDLRNTDVRAGDVQPRELAEAAS